MGQTCQACKEKEPFQDKPLDIKLDSEASREQFAESGDQEDEENSEEEYEINEILCPPHDDCTWAAYPYHPPPAPALPSCICTGHICRIHHTGQCSCPEIFLDCCGKVRLKYTSLFPYRRKNYFCCTGVSSKSRWDFCKSPRGGNDANDQDDLLEECQFPECMCSNGGPKGPGSECVCPCVFKEKIPDDCYCKCIFPNIVGTRIHKKTGIKSSDNELERKDIINEKDLNDFLCGTHLEKRDILNEKQLKDYLCPHLECLGLE